METDKDYLNILAKLRGLRAERYLTITTVAKELGISIEALRGYETNKRKIPLILLIRILKLYRVDIDIFFTNLCDNIRK